MKIFEGALGREITHVGVIATVLLELIVSRCTTVLLTRWGDQWLWPFRSSSRSPASCGGGFAVTKWFLSMAVMYSITASFPQAQLYVFFLYLIHIISMLLTRRGGKCQELLPSCPRRFTERCYLDLIIKEFFFPCTHSHLERIVSCVREHTQAQAHIGQKPVCHLLGVM